MEELVKYIVKNLVEDKDAVEVTSREEEKVVVLEVSVAENDTITLAYWKGNSTQAISILGNDYGATYLTVEVVEKCNLK